jgi:hypothetical protein
MPARAPACVWTIPSPANTIPANTSAAHKIVAHKIVAHEIVAHEIVAMTNDVRSPA